MNNKFSEISKGDFIYRIFENNTSAVMFETEAMYVRRVNINYPTIELYLVGEFDADKYLEINLDQIKRKDFDLYYENDKYYYCYLTSIENVIKYFNEILLQKISCITNTLNYINNNLEYNVNKSKEYLLSDKTNVVSKYRTLKDFEDNVTISNIKKCANIFYEDTSIPLEEREKVFDKFIDNKFIA